MQVEQRDAMALESQCLMQSAQIRVDAGLQDDFLRCMDHSKRLIEELQKENAALKIRAAQAESKVVAERAVSSATIASLREQIKMVAKNSNTHYELLVAARAELNRYRQYEHFTPFQMKIMGLV